jgi:hypothetical protein
MSDSSEKSILAEKVVDAIYGELLSSPMKVREDWPEQVKERMLKTRKTFKENHRKFALELYEKHMSIEQLQELLTFHTSEIGVSIKKAEAMIQKELGAKYKELESQKERPEGVPVVRSLTYKFDDEDDS